MKNDKEKLIGILGGLGPLATINIQEKIIKNTKASKDQKHIKTITFSDPKIPNRSNFINCEGPSPIPYIIKDLKKLEYLGSDFLIIACATSYAFLSEIKKQIKKPVINIIDETIHYILKRFKAKKIGILASSGSIKTKIYQKPLISAGFNIIDLPNIFQEKYVNKAINDIKANRLKQAEEKILKAIDFFAANKADLVILGCTELPIVIDSKKIRNIIIIDINEIIALSIIKKAKYK